MHKQSCWNVLHAHGADKAGKGHICPNHGYVTEIKQLGKDVRITLYEKARLDPAGIPAIMAQYRRGLQFKADHEPKFILTPQGRLIEELMKFAGELAKLAEPLE